MTRDNWYRDDWFSKQEKWQQHDTYRDSYQYRYIWTTLSGYLLIMMIVAKQLKAQVGKAAEWFKVLLCTEKKKIPCLGNLLKEAMKGQLERAR